jgi:hypothetical protein
MLKHNDIQNTYPKTDEYIFESIYSDLQQTNFLQTLKQSFDLLIELCIKLPQQLKQIIYLAEDIVIIAQSIPSSIDKTKVVDMRDQVCDVVKTIASYAPKYQVGLHVNIDEQINVIQNQHG